MLDWRISLGTFVVLIIAFALIWPRISTNWEQEFRSTYESVSDDIPIISDVFNVYLDENRLIYVKEECDNEDIKPDFLLHVTPVNPDNLLEERREAGFNNFDFGFEEYGLQFDDKCLIQFTLPGYDITRIRTGQYIREGDELPAIWIAEAFIAQE